jgi:hypothetical protein
VTFGSRSIALLDTTVANGHFSMAPRSFVGLLTFAGLLMAGCGGPQRSRGEELARVHCAACHAYPEPQLLDKRSWEAGVLPQMAPRLGITSESLQDDIRNPHLVVSTKTVAREDWERIIAFYRTTAPDALPPQSLPAQPEVDPPFFRTDAFVPTLESSGIITLLTIDATRERIFVGEAGTNTLRIFDWHRRLLSSLRLASPPTDVIVESDHVFLLESGILNPNDEPRGRLVRYDLVGADSLRSGRVLIDSLFRPVFVRQFDFDRDGRNEFVICEYGNNRGRLALYRLAGSRYQRQVLDGSPGAIRFEIHEMTGDGAPDIVALFAQGDERIVMFENNGRGEFSKRPRTFARFPPVYGSMNFSMHDFNGDGHMDIVYVNGDNFDYSRVLKPYHGLRILENDGHNAFRERYFFPLYGAARAEVADFDGDGDLDVVVTSNFAAREHPERGIVYLENASRYVFRPYAFTLGATNHWNLTAVADLDRDGSLDVIIGAMDLESIATMQGTQPDGRRNPQRDPLLVLQNRTNVP